MEKSHPEVDLDMRCLEYGELIREHRSADVDIIFNMDFDPEAIDACDFEQIYKDELYVVVGKSHRLASFEEVSLADLSGEKFVLPDDQAYPGLAQKYEQILRGACDPSLTRRYRDIDTFYFIVAQGDFIRLSSGHNHRQFEGSAVFLFHVDVDTAYTVSAQWLKRASDPRIAEIAKESARVCADCGYEWEKCKFAAEREGRDACDAKWDRERAIKTRSTCPNQASNPK